MNIDPGIAHMAAAEAHEAAQTLSLAASQFRQAAATITPELLSTWESNGGNAAREAIVRLRTSLQRCEDQLSRLVATAHAHEIGLRAQAVRLAA